MRKIVKGELDKLLNGRNKERLNVQHSLFENLDLSGYDLTKINFAHSDFRNVCLAGANLEESSLYHTMFSPGCSLKGANLRNVNLSESLFRYCDFSYTNMEGANLYCSNFEYSDMTHIRVNKDTKYYEMRCPKEGAFLGYKRCLNESLVQLLIPADAKRSSATANSCRCSKAKVLSIKNFDNTRKLDMAWSVVDEDFVYRVGEYVEVDNFNEDRWMDSTTGIHFWMTREEAYNYLE